MAVIPTISNNRAALVISFPGTAFCNRPPSVKTRSGFFGRNIAIPPARHSKSLVFRQGIKCSWFVADILTDAINNLELESLEKHLDSGGGLDYVLQEGVKALEMFSKLSEGTKWETLVAATGTWIYLTARPGVLIGAIDAYLLAPVQTAIDGLAGRRNLRRSDFVLGERVGEGSFGTVYAGAMLPRGVEVDQEFGRRTRRIEEYQGFEKFPRVILKKVKVGVEGAEECGDMEEWFNYRMCRAAPETCAEFLGSFVSDTTLGQFVKGGKWLVWKYETNSTLADYMRGRNFPENLTELVFEGKLNEQDPARRKALIIKRIMRQIITSLKKMHETGIVHRDVKPSNLVVTDKGRVKFIDFGAATDLRVGKNYFPDRGMLDPDYCPPELYVMPEETPKPPPEPVAAILSPFVWQVNSPDLFDMYSAGIILLQMSSPNLRTPVGFQSFKSEIRDVNYDLNEWRRRTKIRMSFDTLDADDGRGWDLATKLICERGSFRRGRLSAAAALRHPYFLFRSDQTAAIFSKLARES